MDNHHALKDTFLSGMPSGILNSGNSCFANSALQSLLSTIAFRSGSVQAMKRKVSEREQDPESANKIPTPLPSERGRGPESANKIPTPLPSERGRDPESKNKIPTPLP